MKEEIINQMLLDIVEEQLANDETGHTNATITRLIQDGSTEIQAKLYIASCIQFEIEITKGSDQQFDPERFLRNLNNLPVPPSK